VSDIFSLYMYEYLLSRSVIIDYEAAGDKRNFCYEHYLSQSTLRMLQTMKRQLAEHLHKLQFLVSSDSKASAANVNSNNEDLVRAIVCAGLYPNVASIRLSKWGPPVLRTITDKRAVLHKKSVNASESHFRYPWCVYHLKLKGASVTVHDCSEVSPMSLIFFGEWKKTTRQPNGVDTIVVDDFVKFKCDTDTEQIFVALRNALDELLEYKVAQPGPTNWDEDRKEGFVLKTLVELLETQPTGSVVDFDVDDDDDDQT